MIHNIDKKTVLKNLFFGFSVWVLGLFVASVFAAAWAAAVKAPWVMNVGMVLYLTFSTVFLGWLCWDRISSAKSGNGRHNGNGGA